MREKIHEFIWTILSFGRECSDEWLANQKISGRPFIDHRRKYLYSLLGEEIKKELLTDEEIRMSCLGEGNYYAGELGESASESSPVIMPQFRRVRQAQLQKILKKMAS